MALSFVHTRIESFSPNHMDDTQMDPAVAGDEQTAPAAMPMGDDTAEEAPVEAAPAEETGEEVAA